MESETVENARINQRILMRIERRILLMELENLKTKKLRPSDMTDKIRKLIEFEVDKNDDQ